MTIKIGIDLDNTIINYKNSFKKFLNKNNIKKNVIDKHSLKKILNRYKVGVNWTHAQEEIYGSLIYYAKPFKFFLDFEKFAIKNKIDLYIISHKTKYSQYSKKYNLYNSANNWLKKNITYYKYKIFYCKTVNKKIEKINNLKLDYFIDDLIDIFKNKKFSKKTKKIFFSNKKNNGILTFDNWNKIKIFIKTNENIK